MPEQSKEFLEAAINAAEAIDRIAKKITDLKDEQKEIEDTHGITAIKKEIKGLNEEMETTAYGILRQAPAAAQGKLFAQDVDE